MENKKGFTLIELIVVIAVLGILVLLAAPKFLDYVEKSKNVQIANDIKSYENEVGIKLIEGDLDLTKNWKVLSNEELEEVNNSNKLYNKKQKIVDNLGGTNYIIQKGVLNTNSKLKGTFIYGENEVFYYEGDLEGVDPVGVDPGGSNPGGSDGDGIPDGSDDPNNARFPFIWTAEDNKVTIIDYIGTNLNVVIPSVIDGKPVVALGNRSFYNKGLTSVSIPNSVGDIESEAFRLNSLTGISIPNSLTEIESNTFADNELKSLIIPNSIIKIGLGAFQNNELTSVSIPNSVRDIESEAFRYNSLTAISIPNSLTEIKSFTFADNDLKSLIIPNSITKIGAAAFSNNDEIESLDLGNSVQIVSSGSFSVLAKIEILIIPDSVRTIERSAFIGLTNLKKLVIGRSVQAMQPDSFKLTPNLKEVNNCSNIEMHGFFPVEQGVVITSDCYY